MEPRPSLGETSDAFTLGGRCALGVLLNRKRRWTKPQAAMGKAASGAGWELPIVPAAAVTMAEVTTLVRAARIGRESAAIRNSSATGTLGAAALEIAVIVPTLAQLLL
jgi:hypothetical protein